MESRYKGRRAVHAENDQIRVTTLVEGGHLAEILDKSTGVSPLWIPPWRSIEPSSWTPSNTRYGSDAESKLLSGIMGHNLCVDLFGPPSPEEAAAGLTVHGEASVVPYESEGSSDGIMQRAELPIAGLTVERQLRLDGAEVLIKESVRNRSMYDRPCAWTQHVTLGPPFLVKGETRFSVPATRSQTLDGVDFEWPYRPRAQGPEDMQVLTNEPESGAFSTHLLDPARDEGFFTAWTPSLRLAFGYRWRRSDFPWIGIWDENYSRKTAPWNGETLTRGMEFGASPFPEHRRKMIDRGSMFGAPAYRWIPAGSTVTVEYSAFVRPADSMPDFRGSMGSAGGKLIGSDGP